MPRDSRVYLEDILEALHDYTRGYSRERLRSDTRTADAVVRNLEVVGEAVKRRCGPNERESVSAKASLRRELSGPSV